MERLKCTPRVYPHRAEKRPGMFSRASRIPVIFTLKPLSACLAQISNVAAHHSHTLRLPCFIDSCTPVCTPRCVHFLLLDHVFQDGLLRSLFKKHDRQTGHSGARNEKTDGKNPDHNPRCTAADCHGRPPTADYRAEKTASSVENMRTMSVADPDPAPGQEGPARLGALGSLHQLVS